MKTKITENNLDQIVLPFENVLNAPPVAIGAELYNRKYFLVRVENRECHEDTHYQWMEAMPAGGELKFLIVNVSGRENIKRTLNGAINIPDASVYCFDSLKELMAWCYA